MAKNSTKSNRTTLSDVARKAGVSVSTASLVLTGKAKARRISEEAHHRVRMAAKELDYSPNLLVHSMQSGATNVLSFFNAFRNRRKDDVYMDRLSTAIERAAGARGYDILVHCNFMRTAEKTYQMLNGGRADGVILFAPHQDDPLLSYLRASRMPVVMIGSSDKEGKLSSVRDDVNQGMRIVAEKLASLGDHNIAMLSDDSGENADAIIRVNLLRRYLLEFDIQTSESCVIPVSEFNPDSYGPALSRLLSSANHPTAIFCWHDLLGYQILDWCYANNISIPDEFSLIGYDGLRWHSASPHILDSILVDLDLLALEVIDLLDNLIQSKDGEIQEKKIPVTFFQGDTLAKSV